MPPLEPYGSQDNIEDIISLLEELNVHYALVIGVPGEDRTRMYTSNNNGNQEKWQLLDRALKLTVYSEE